LQTKNIKGKGNTEYLSPNCEAKKLEGEKTVVAERE